MKALREVRDLRLTPEAKLDRIEELAALRRRPFRWLLRWQIRGLRKEISEIRSMELEVALRGWSRPSRADVFRCEEGHLHTRIDQGQSVVRAVDLVEVAVKFPGTDLWMVEILSDEGFAIMTMEISVDADSEALHRALRDLVLPPEGSDG